MFPAPRLARSFGFIALLLFVTMLLASCGDKEGTQSTTEGADACGAYGEVLGAMCDVMDRCPGAFYPIAYRNRAQCMDILCFAMTCRLEDDESDGERTWEIVQRTPRVNEPVKDACVSWLEQASCEALRRPENSPCDGLLGSDDDDDYSGNRADAGEACRYDNCRSGLFCTQPVVDPADGLMTCAVCEELPAAGEPCNYQAKCDEEHWCDWIEGGTICREREADGVTCAGDQQCRSGFCNQGSMSCDGGGNLGDGCSAPTDCRYGGFCNDEGRCEALRLNGAACADETQCGNGICDEGNRRCGYPDGSTCPSYGHGYCQSGVCDDTQRVCIPGKAVGESCDSDQECASQNCDYWGSRTCKESCTTHGDCGNGRYCDDSSRSCGQLKGDGASCYDDEECEASNCNLMGRCGAPPAVGDSCSSSEQCYPIGYCRDGQCQARRRPGQECEFLDQCQEPFLCVEGRCQIMNLSCRPARAGELCAFLRVCDDASYCDRSDFRCKARARAGQDCTGDASCAPGLYCLFGNEGASCAAPGKAGESCAENLRCGEEFYCDDVTCRPRGEAGVSCETQEHCLPGLGCIDEGDGKKCAETAQGRSCDYDRPCPPGLFCDVWGACKLNHGLGDDCRVTEPCQDGLYCDSSEGCAPKKALGEHCRHFMPCADDLYCNDQEDVCEAAYAIGEPCETYRSQCGANRLCKYDQELGQSVCRERAELGESCDDNVECKSGICDRSFGCLASLECKMP